MKRRDPDMGTDQMNGVPPATDASTSQSSMDSVKDKAGQMTDKAQEKIGQATDKAKQQTVSQLSTRKGQAADSLDDVSDAVSQVGTQLRQNDHDTLAQYAGMAAQQVNRAASYLRSHDVNEMLGQAQDFARSQPAIFLAGAFALGLLGARFLKSGSPQPQGTQRAQSMRNRYRYPSYQPPGGRYAGVRRPGGPNVRPGYSNYGGTNGAMRGAPSGTPGAPRMDPGAGARNAPSGSYAPDARRDGNPPRS